MGIMFNYELFYFVYDINMCEIIENDTKPTSFYRLIETIRNVWYQESEDRVITEQDLNEMQEASAVLSSILPGVSESNLFDIDDLLYPRIDLHARNPSGTQLSESIPERIDESLQTLEHIISIYAYDSIDLHPVVLMAFLQSLEHSSYKASKDKELYRNIISHAIRLLEKRNINKICNALKILRIVFYKNNNGFKRIFKKFSRNDILEIYWFFELKNMPQASHPNSKRITTWLTQQSAIITDSLKLITSMRYYFFRSLKLQDLLKKENLQDYILLLLECGFKFKCIKDLKLYIWPHGGTFAVDHVYEFFMSARNEGQQIKCMEYFYEAIVKVSLSKFNTPLSPLQILDGFCSLIIDFLYNILHRYNFLECGRTADELNEIARCSNINIETGIIDNSIDAKEINTLKMNEKINDPANIENVFDYTIEQFLFTDDFMRRIQVVAIFYTSVINSEIPKKYGFDENYVSSIFIQCTSLRYYKYLIKSALLDPSERNNCSWYLQIVVEKFPFVFLPRISIHLMKDLLRALNGEEVDEITIKELCFALGDRPTDMI